MKILKFNLIAFGPFQDAAFDLSGGASDFHILFGPNEAGKSSALRALRNLLFGIPVRTADNFRHPHTALRIGARLAGPGGQEIAFIRRKGQNKTLRAEDDKTLLAEDALAPFMGNIGQDLFEQMFAIGHDDLVRGGQEIISGGGRVGQALFSAGAGLIRLQAVQQDLTLACDDLFKPSAQKPRINALLSQLQETLKSRKDALLHAKEWKDRESALHETQKHLEAIGSRLTDLKQQRARLERIRHALPLMARKKEIDLALVDCRQAPALADDFGRQRNDVERGLAMARNDLARAAADIEKINGQLAALTVPEKLLEHGPAVSAIQQDLGSYRKARQDRPGLEARMRLLQTQAANQLSEIGIDNTEGKTEHLKLPPGIIGDIRDLAKQYERLTARLEANQDQLDKIRNRMAALAKQEKALPVPTDMTRLRAALESAQQAGPIEKKRAESRRAASEMETQLNNRLNRQTLWTGDMAALDALPLPPMETIDYFAKQFLDAAREIDRQKTGKAAIEADLVTIDIELTGMDLAQEVPTEADLEAARRLRDDRWRLISQQLAGRGPAPSENREAITQLETAAGLADAFEQSMGQADLLADRLRREAAQVSRKALRLAEKAHKHALTDAIGAALDAAVAQHDALAAKWARLWEPVGIVPLSPPEMRAWLADMQTSITRYADLRAARSAEALMTAELESLKILLVQALSSHHKTLEATRPLEELAAAAKACITAGEKAAEETAAVRKELASLEEESSGLTSARTRLEKELATWKEKWNAGITALSLTPDTGPGAAQSVIDGIRDAKKWITDADTLRKRIDGIDRDCAVFIKKVNDLKTLLAPELDAERPDIVAESLNDRLATAREAATLRKNLIDQLEKARRDQADAEKQMAENNIRLDSLCREALCDEPEKLAEIEQQARLKKQLFDENEKIEKDLRHLSAGATVDDFIAEAGSLDADAIGPETERMDAEINTLEKESAALNQHAGVLKKELEHMDGRAAAAGYAEDAEAVLASIDAEVAQYCRLKIASAILSRTIEQYREKYQGPMIRRASELFRQMTLGSFTGIRAEYDEKGDPVLVGIRPHTNEQVRVEGMSDGTADQLYLALRLAGLEQYLENSTPLPFVVDDILLRFDDRRATATLNVLAELSKKTQVIFFTHHQHLVDLANSELRAVSPVIHTMSVSG
jgi:uncharacterized protein YhaN